MFPIEEIFPPDKIRFTKIANIFAIRNSPNTVSQEFAQNSQTNEFFNNLPTISKENIALFKKNLNEQMSLRDALEQIDLNFEFSIEKCIQFGSHDPLDQYYVNSIIFFYYCLAWVKQENDKIRVNDFHFIISSFTQQNGCPFQEVANDLFVALTLFAISNDKFTFTAVEYTLIFEHITNNTSLTNDYFPFLMILVSRGIKTGCKQIYKSTLNLVNSLFANHRKIVDDTRIIYLVPLVNPFLSELEPLALSLLCYLSEASEDNCIRDAFILVPTIMLSIVTMQDSKINADDCVRPIEIEENSNQENEDNAFALPSETTVQSETTYEEFAPRRIQEAINAISLLFERINKDCAQGFIQAISHLSSATQTLNHKLDFLIAVSPLIRAASKRVSIDNLESFLFNEVSFNPKVNIFHGKLPENLNFVRNTIIGTMKYSSVMMCKIITNYASSPFLFAEFITRLLYFQNISSEQAPVVSGETVIKSLLDVSLSLPERENNHRKQMLLARSVIFTYLFDLFAQPTTALQCFSSETFMSNFSVLMQEPAMSTVVLNSLSKAMTGLTFLPGPVEGIFCALLANCCAKRNDEFFYKLGTKLSHIIVDSMTVNHCIASSISQFIVPLLQFLSNKPDETMLDIALQVLFAYAQTNGTVDLPDQQFNMVIDIVHQVEGDEPSEATKLHLVNILNNTSNGSMEKMSIIQIPSAVSYIICCFAKSEKLPRILKYFKELGEYSEQNIYLLHEGELTVYLIQSLKGEFVCKGRKVETNYTEQEIDEIVFPLISLMLEVKSSCQVDKLMFSLIMPDEEGNFPALSIKALKEMNSVLYSIDGRPNPIFPIGQSTPLISTTINAAESVNEGMILSFWLKIDCATSKQTTGDFIIMKMSDTLSNLKMTIYVQGSSIYLSYETEAIRSSAQIFKDIQTSAWQRYTIGIYKNGEQITACPYFGHIAINETDYMAYQMKGTIKAEFAFTNSKTMPIGRPCIVQLGPFVAIKAKMEDNLTGNVATAKIEILSKDENVVFSNNTFENCINKEFMRPMPSFGGTLPSHIVVGEFYKTFNFIEKAPENYVELVIPLIMHGNNLHNYQTKEANFISPIQDNYSFDESLTLISSLTKIPKEKLSEFGEFVQMKSVHLSDLSGILFEIQRRAPKLIGYTLFNACASLLNTINDTETQNELVENVLFNAWIWCAADDLSLQRIVVYWSNNAANLATPKLFRSFLFQTYALIFFSTEKHPRIEASLFKNLGEISSVYFTDDDVLDLINLVISIRDQEKSDIYLSLIENFVKKGKRIGLDVCSKLFTLADVYEFPYYTKLLGLLHGMCPEHIRYITYHTAIRFFNNHQYNERPFNNDLHCIKYLLDNDPNKEFEKFGNLIVNTDHLWYLWYLIIALWKPSASEACANLIAGPLLASENISRNLINVTCLMDFFEAFNIFDVKHFRFVLFSKLCDVIIALDDERKQRASKAIVTIAIQEFFFVFTKSTHNKELLELMKNDDSGIVEDKEQITNILSENENEESFTMKPFSFDDFIRRINDDKKDYEYKIRTFTPTQELFDLCKKIKEIIPLNTKTNEGWIQIAEYIEKCSNGLPEPRQVNVDIFQDVTENSMKVRKQQLCNNLSDIRALFKEPENIEKKQSDDYVSARIREQISTFHIINDHSFVRSEIATKLKDTKPAAARFIPLTFNLIKSRTPSPLFNGFYSYNENFGNEKANNFDENNAQLTTNAKVILQSIKVDVVINMWLTKMLINQVGNQPLVVEYSSINFVVLSGEKKAALYTHSMESTVFEFDDTLKRNQFTDNLKKLWIVVIDNPKLYLPALISDWYEGKLSNFELLMNINILYGKTLSDFEDYIIVPTILRRTQNGTNAVTFGTLTKVITNEGRAEAIKQIYESKEIKSDEVINEMFNNFQTCIPEFYSSFTFFAQRKVIAPETFANPLILPYRYRTWLDSPALSDKISTFIKQAFLISIPSKRKNQNVFKRMKEELEIPVSNVSRVFFTNDSSMMYVISFGTLYCYRITYYPIFGFEEISKIQGFTKLGNAVTTVAGNKLLIYSQQQFEVKCINPKCEVITKTTLAAITNMITAWPRIVFTTDYGLVQCSEFNTFPSKSRDIYHLELNKEIKLMCAHESLDIVALAERGGLLTVLDISKSRKLGEINVHEEIIAMTITPKFGFVIVSTNTKMFVISPDCTILQTSQAIPRVSLLIPFTSPSGADYVYAIGGKTLSLFEAMFPSNVKVILTFSSSPISASYSRERQTLIVVLSNRKVVFIPFLQSR